MLSDPVSGYILIKQIYRKYRVFSRFSLSNGRYFSTKMLINQAKKT